MRVLASLAMTAAIAMGSLSARAEEPVIVPVQQEGAATTQVGGVDTGKIIAVGAGIIVGGAIGASAMTFRGATLVGAIAGGLLVGWWYGDGDDVAPLNPQKR